MKTLKNKQQIQNIKLNLIVKTIYKTKDKKKLEKFENLAKGLERWECQA